MLFRAEKGTAHMRRSGFAGTSSLLLLLAIAAVGGFLFWLYTQAQSLEEDVQPVMDDTASAATAVTLETLAADPASAIGEETVLDTVVVSDRLGRAVFNLRLNDTLSYPVLLEAGFIQRGLTVYSGDRITVGGRFYSLNDSIRDEWLARGAIDSASAEGVPAVASFLLADSVDILEQ